MRKGITSREYNFLKHYIDIESPTFGNAYKSALRAGYTNTYSRVIKRHFSSWRMKLLKNMLKDEDLVNMIKATRHLENNIPIAPEWKIKEIIRKKEKELNLPSLKEIVRELEEFFPRDI